MGVWSYLPKVPDGMDLEQWKRLCAQAENLHDHAQNLTVQSDGQWRAEPLQVVGAEVEPVDASDLARAQQAVAELAAQRQRMNVLPPEKLLDAISVAASNRRKRLSRHEANAWLRLRSEMFLGHHRTQFAVGQGGFHVGALTQIAPRRELVMQWADQRDFKTADFLYVYDCGSDPKQKVEAEVEQLLKSTGRRRLDILFVSHFDDDHVSGIPALIGEGKFDVDTVVLPYIDDSEKLIAFGRAAAKSAPVGDFLAKLIVDPVDTLRSFGARRILFVGNGDGPIPDAPLVPTIDGGPADFPWKVASAGDGDPEVRELDRDSFYVRNGAIDLASSTTAGSQLTWKFLPYVRQTSFDAKLIFCETVEILLGWNSGSFLARTSDMSVRKELVERHADVLGKAYGHAFGSKNGTSLSLYSGPALPLRAGATVIEPHLPPADLAKIGWLGTGDAPLRSDRAAYAFEAHFGDLLNAVSTFMLPHHGSIHNSNPRRLIGDADIYFAAADPKRDDWKHPAPQLKIAVEGAGRTFHHVGSDPTSALQEVMVLFPVPDGWS